MKKTSNKSPAFQFYAKDWLTDLKVKSLSFEEKGIYIELLAYSWLEPLPNDIDSLANILSCDKNSLAKICHTFFIEEDDFLFNSKLEKYREEKLKFHNAKAKAGKKGAEKRWQQAKNTGIAQPKHSYSTAIDLPLAKNSSSSSTSSSTSTNNIYKYFQEKINDKSKLTEQAKTKIKTRLKSFSIEDLERAIENFAAAPWWMENNSHRGVAWFFHSDDRIDQFLNLEEQARKKVDTIWVGDKEISRDMFNKLEKEGKIVYGIDGRAKIIK